MKACLQRELGAETSYNYPAAGGGSVPDPGEPAARLPATEAITKGRLLAGRRLRKLGSSAMMTVSAFDAIRMTCRQYLDSAPQGLRQPLDATRVSHWDRCREGGARKPSASIVDLDTHHAHVSRAQDLTFHARICIARCRMMWSAMSLPRAVVRCRRCRRYHLTTSILQSF